MGTVYLLGTMSSWVERVAKPGSSVVFGWEGPQKILSPQEQPWAHFPGCFLDLKLEHGSILWQRTNTNCVLAGYQEHKRDSEDDRVPLDVLTRMEKRKQQGGEMDRGHPVFTGFLSPPRSRCFSNRASPRRRDSQLTDQMAQYSTVGMFLRKRVCAE